MSQFYDHPVLRGHPLCEPDVVAAVASAASTHRGRPWVATGFTDLNDRASHPCGIFAGEPFAVFGKLSTAPDGHRQFATELRGLALLGSEAGVRIAVPVDSGVVAVGSGALLLCEALPQRPPSWSAIGRLLGALHGVTADRYGLGFDGYFGPLPQDNRPTPTNRWADFYAERRVLPRLRSAVDSGHLPPELAAGVERLVGRLPALGGPEPRPTLLHGDAQQNNFVSTPTGAVPVDAAPYFGHPEIDLALLDYFQPVPDAVFDAYRELAPIEPGFPERRELWRIFGYLAVLTVDGGSAFGRGYRDRLAAAVRRYG
jgi:fructosamine-3-kinase